MSPRFSSKLKRRPPVREPKRKLIVVCEGKVTEPEYLTALARDCRALIALDLSIERGAGTPMSLVERAAALSPRKRRKRAESFEKRDEIWVMFDRDEHPYFIDAINRAQSVGVGVAYSNPCFELWLALHFESWDRPMSRHAMQDHIRKRFPQYDRTKAKTIPFKYFAEFVEQAEARAVTLCSNRNNEGDTCGNPSTTVYCLTRRIREFGKT
jgi:hypothetical protein